MAFYPAWGGGSGGSGFDSFSHYGSFNNTSTDYINIDVGANVSNSDYWFVVLFPSDKTKYALIIEHISNSSSANVYCNGKSARTLKTTTPVPRGTQAVEIGVSGSTISIGSPTSASYAANYPFVGKVYWGVK